MTNVVINDLNFFPSNCEFISLTEFLPEQTYSIKKRKANKIYK